MLDDTGLVNAGEIACAYLDGTLTLEQAVLVAHARARAAALCPPGVMASVGETACCMPLCAHDPLSMSSNMPSCAT